MDLQASLIKAPHQRCATSKESRYAAAPFVNVKAWRDNRPSKLSIAVISTSHRLTELDVLRGSRCYVRFSLRPLFTFDEAPAENSQPLANGKNPASLKFRIKPHISFTNSNPNRNVGPRSSDYLLIPSSHPESPAHYRMDPISVTRTAQP